MVLCHEDDPNPAPHFPIMTHSDLHLEDVLTDRSDDSDLLEIPVADKVFRVFILLTGMLFLALAAEILYLNIGKGDFFEKRAAANMSDEKIQPAARGIVFDRFGKPLLRNEPANKIFILPRDFPESPEERIELLRKIGDTLDIPWDDLRKRIEEKDWGQSDKFLISADATHNQIVALTAFGIKGVYIEPSFKRIHEIPLAFSHVLGYTGLVNTADMRNNESLVIDDEIGRAGIEAYYDAYLRGVNGKEVFYRNAIGKIEEQRSIREPAPGNTLITNIDRDLQYIMYTRLSDTLSSLGRNVGAAIAMNPKNGEILGFVNIPSFDARNIHAAISAPFEPLFNRAVSGLYNPGSTIKPLVGVAALTEGVIDTTTKIFSKGYIEIPNPYNPSQPGRFLDWQPNGWVDIYDALAKSSNIYFYEVTGGFENQRGMGIDVLKQWWQKFMLDKKTGIDIAGERQGFLPDPGWKEEEKNDQWRVGDTYNVSIGQGDLLVTPIALLNYISAIANGGVFYKPRIVKEIRANESVIFENKMESIADIRNDIREHIDDVREGMRRVVSEPYGSAHSLSKIPMEIAAKTGTAQVQNNARVNAFFVGFAPFDDPEIALLILVENAREGSLNTIPVAKDIFLWYYENRLDTQR